MSERGSTVRRAARRAVVAGAIAGAAVAVIRARAAAQRRAGDAAGTRAGVDAHPVRGRTRNQRRVELARTGGRAGADFALHRARRVFAGAERQAELDEEFQLRTAAQVAETLGNMKGAFMKLGQMASYLDIGLPDHVREALAGLQQDAPPMSAELAAGVVERELGAPPDQLFLEWDPEPIAAASIGQVHRAITRDEQAVAVKVQYPGVDDAIRSDLESAGVIFGAMGLALPGFEPGPLVEEIRARVVEELDYVREARNTQLFADFYRGHPFIHVPDVVPALSTARVLTTELAEGVRFDTVLTWDQDERNLAAETIYRFVFRSLYRLSAFNGDPHPGNYLFRPGGHVTFLDFGLVKQFTPEEVDLFADMLQAMVFEGDTARFRHVIERIGLLRPGTPVSNDEVQEYYRHFYEFVIEDRTVTITPEWSTQAASRYFDPTGEYGPIIRAANLPPSFVIIQRINLGLMAILGDLHATANFRRIANELWPWVDGPPSTPQGEAEARWLAERTAQTA
ncbi:MAG TPA: AarF/ABC1/UbiB kinase family protein [Acidimicrobiales bacterium]|nr:AarF/ABC1/UbiB kinase family protein [Acidimicrobiales bacterium]